MAVLKSHGIDTVWAPAITTTAAGGEEERGSGVVC